MLHLTEGAKVVGLLPPATDAAGRTSRYITVKDALRAWILVYMDQANAATIALTPKQATAVAGTGSKVLANVVPIWACLDEVTTEALVRAADGTSYTTDAAVKRKVVAFQIEAAALDVGGGFDCIAITTGASNVANLTAAVAILEPRYPQVTPPTVITD
jgi:hypothetical protein